MSYQVIARKWRPNSFSELLGQNHVSQTLLNALKSQRLPHALLFTGPRGTGKTSSARILAKALRCTQAKDFSPCNLCGDCTDISAGRSIDVIEIDGASNNGVDAVRELRDNIGYMPSSGQYKLYIIDEVHMLSSSAFNALLKTLEEPPPHVIFILATTEAHKIPNTILSRCQRFDFRRISTRTISERLEHICQSDNVSVDKEALWLIARQADGSLRDSQSILDQVITFCEGAITTKKVSEILGLTDRQLLMDTLSALINRSSLKIIEVIEHIYQAGYDPKVFSQDLLEELRHLLMVKLCPQDKIPLVVDLPLSEIDVLKQLSQQLSEEDVHLLFDMALKGGHDIPRSQDPKVVLEMLLLRMTSAPRIRNLTELFSTKNSTPPITVKATENRPTLEKPLGTKAQNKHEKWADLVERVKKVNRIIGAQLEHTYLIDISGKQISIGLPTKMKFLYEQLTHKDFQKKFQNYIATFWGQNYKLDVQLKSGEKTATIMTPKQIEDKKQVDQQNAIHQQIENHPAIKSAHNLFKTQIQSIKENT